MESLRYSPADLTCRIERTGYYYQGTWCAATLYRPAATGDAALPAILMVHGWGGTQDTLTVPFYEEFTRAGFVVMSFDYTGWGDSAGLPRHTISARGRVREADAALAFLKSRPGVDRNRIVVWGTSFGGGHAVELAAEHPELLGAIAQVPMLDGLAAVRAVPLARLLRFGLYCLVDLIKPGQPVYIQVVSAPGAFSSMDRDDAGKALALGEQSAGRGYDNRVAARSLMTMGPYRPFKRLRDIRIPTLLLGATGDSVAPFIEGKIRRVNNPHLTVDTVEANHFEPYFEPVFSSVISKQLAFLKSLVA
ncbi:hydrolase, alpha/beta fold family, putative [Isoalcanivorax pacificus W11-5]|uniref:Hydrolase, alpha/beta fold family, putative n=1 Tax=Isoalcanivorax pacificus W11-5 TaxID=391936 RepID=A0A0B4XH91_9GAMM|nr:alpha/beta fold hydrolase [Isoalcanivorax pacificus]AJD47494.1 hydrolase, alpha/beta fold family, putative [Isoalcanivorax pacificus W11-5]